MTRYLPAFAALGACVAVLGGCGDDSAGPNKPTPPASPAVSSIHLQSDASDYIGLGQAYGYTKANAVLTVSASGPHLGVSVNGDQWWYGDFEVPGVTSLEPGTWSGLTRYPFNGPEGGLSWYGDGRGCNTLTGSLTIDSVAYAQTNLQTIVLHFDQHCEGGVPALHGSITWDAADTTAPPGPTNPIPGSLWHPPFTTPPTGNFVYLQSDPGDYIGQGVTDTYTPPTSPITVNSNGTQLTVSVAGYSGTFQAMNSVARLATGYYPDLHRYPFNNPTKGGLNWDGNGRGCNTLTGWFVVDSITFTGDQLTAIDLRFEQHCEGLAPALRGVVHWVM